MPTLSVKENFMRVVNKEMPEYISTYDLFWAFNGPPFLFTPPAEGEPMKNMFGVESVQDSAGLLPPMPKTHDFILTDVTKWRDIVKIPDFDVSESAWAEMGKESQDNRNPDLPFGGGVSTGWFQPLVGLMGFTEGLSACFEEPEEVKAMMEYWTDWSCEMSKKYIQYFKPDFGFIADDIAHERNPFLSLPMFQDIIAPYWRRFYATFLEAGLPVGMHNCGHFELYLEDLVDMGCTFWDPVQSSNDYVGIKAQYGRNIALCTHVEGRFWDDDTTEEEVKQAARDFINLMAPGGGFAMFAYQPPEEDAPPMPGITQGEANRSRWIWEVFDSMRYDFYK